MSDNFIPLNQSTPVHQTWQPGRNHHQRYQNHRNHSHSYRRVAPYNKWGNSSRSSFGSNSSNNSYGQENKMNIDAYLHPSMLKDPWESLRQRNQCNNTTT